MSLIAGLPKRARRVTRAERYADNSPERDPVDVMVDVVSGFERFVTKARSSEGRSLKYRANLLWVHALAAMTMAPLFAATGKSGMSSPSMAVLREIPGTPTSIAVLLGAGGLVLGLGCIVDLRRLEIVGLVILSMFYLILSVSFAAAGVKFYFFDGVGAKPTIYAPVVYLHLTIIMGVHMGTLISRGWRSRLKVPDA